MGTGANRGEIGGGTAGGFRGQIRGSASGRSARLRTVQGFPQKSCSSLPKSPVLGECWEILLFSDRMFHQDIKTVCRDGGFQLNSPLSQVQVQEVLRHVPKLEVHEADRWVQPSLVSMSLSQHGGSTFGQVNENK